MYTHLLLVQIEADNLNKTHSKFNKVNTQLRIQQRKLHFS